MKRRPGRSHCLIRHSGLQRYGMRSGSRFTRFAAMSDFRSETIDPVLNSRTACQHGFKCGLFEGQQTVFEHGCVVFFQGIEGGAFRDQSETAVAWK